MYALAELEEKFPVMPGRTFQANYHDREHENHNAVGSFWEVALELCTLVIKDQEIKNFGDFFKKVWESGASLTLLEKRNGRTSFDEIVDRPNRTDYENAYIAFFQNSPDAAFLLLKSGLASEEEMNISMESIRALVMATR